MNAVPLEVVPEIVEQPIAERSISPAIQLNLNVRGLGQSSTLAINERSACMEKQGRKVYRMGLGQSPFPVPETVVEALRENAHQKDYLPVWGLEALRQAVAGFHRRVNGIDRKGEGVLIGPGSKELMFILQLVYYGDLVVPSPSWVSYTPQAHIVGRQIRWVRTRRENGWRLQPQELEELCLEDPGRPRILILNYPSNPLGVTYSPAQLEELAAVARRYGMIVLSDEIYGELHFRGGHHSIARFYPEGTIISSGLSKWCGAGGWRLGTFTFPAELDWLKEAMATVASETFTTTSAPIQYAAVRAFEGGPEIADYLERSRRILRAMGPAVASRLRAAGCQLPEPEGGFYLMPDLSGFRETLAVQGIHSSPQLCERLLQETGVATLPGTQFGRSARELSLRIAYVNFDGGRALHGAAQAGGSELDERFLWEYCRPVMEGVERMAGWLERR